MPFKASDHVLRQHSNARPVRLVDFPRLDVQFPSTNPTKRGVAGRALFQFKSDTPASNQAHFFWFFGFPLSEYGHTCQVAGRGYAPKEPEVRLSTPTWHV